ncbi:MAG: helix-turn-helix transcriptional regulator [Betaproteobacteria bacterium]|jgi:XRE family transcriptional regulator, regulator of sulfur utilization|nr:XRE family transcriptional regulator [Betaproteobacteria bacterium]MDE1954205.1 helix-turn-helix transcriptional regulator [Betaproteobacteria bacterium]MDE2153400.1 helix-turn-helix transcriptional regulator [Betaproteobacteria bacterium]MDE2478211.1 helix-turn-helix transcriptional regulator [Betaproteobacteria bacterium]
MAQPTLENSPGAQGEGPPAVGAALQALRQRQRLSLDELSRRAGVSKSMLSQIERNLANPTVAVLWRLSNALGVPLGELLAGGAPGRPETGISLVPPHAIPALKSPDGHCDLRILGPIDLAGRFEWYELSVEPGGVLASEPHEAGTQEHLSVLAGALTVRSAGDERRVRHGETARYAADVAHAISNAGKSPASALLVVVHPG